MTRWRSIAVALAVAATVAGLAAWRADEEAWPEPGVAPADPPPPAALDLAVARSAASAPSSDLDAGAALINAWATALAPVLAPRAASQPLAAPGSPPDAGATRVSAGFGPDAGGRVASAGAEDAGAALTCDPGPVRIGLQKTPIDLVIAIDTSGSMYQAIQGVNAWLLYTLEKALKKANVDYQLIVIVDLEHLRILLSPSRRNLVPAAEVWAPSDAGFNIGKAVQSHDALEAMLETAAAPGASWLSRLRPGADVHLVVVTDDDPSAADAFGFIGRLTTLAEGRLGTQATPAFTFHAILGHEIKAAPWVLEADAAFEGRGCGVRPGVEYQQLAKRTGGLRGSVCRRESLDAFAHALVARSRPGQPCALPLPPSFPAQRVVSVRAIASDGRPGRVLDRAFGAFSCDFAHGSYLLEGEQLSVCHASCARLATEGFEAIEAIATCP